MNPEMMREVEEAGHHVVSPLDDRQVDTVLMNIQAKRKGRQRALILVAALVLCGVGALLLSKVAFDDPREPSYIESANTLKFADGSLVRSQPSAELSVLEASPERIRVTLAQGKANFSVTSNPSRPFEVLAGDVRVSVLGTKFDVQHTQDHVLVVVTEGRVRVTSPSGQWVLGAGQTAQVPPRQASLKEEPPPKPLPEEQDVTDMGAEVSTAPPVSKRVRGDSNAWVEQAKQGNYRRARRMLRRSQSMPRSASDLMLAADTMRITGHPKDALPYLTRVTKKHPKHSSAPLAFFTKGRILSEKLKQPSQAAKAFALVSKRYPKHTLAEHALAQEARSWSLAGNKSKARQAALSYISRYPEGPRLSRVKAYAKP